MARSNVASTRPSRMFVIAALVAAGIMLAGRPVLAQSFSGNSAFSNHSAVPAVNSALPNAQVLSTRGAAATATASRAPGLSPDYQLGPGDKLRITVFGQQDLSGEYQVDGSGNLAFPLIGSVRAGGDTAADLQQAITSKLSPDYVKNASVSVEVLNFRPFYIIGEVKTGGPYPYTSGMTVITAVATAGGFTYRAKEETFTIRRMENGQSVRIAASQDTPVMPGDVITVPERFF